MNQNEYICFICRDEIKKYKKCKICKQIFCKECYIKWAKECVNDIGKDINCPFCIQIFSSDKTLTINALIKEFQNKELENNDQNNNIQKIDSNKNKSIRYNNNNYPNDNQNRKILVYENVFYNCIINTGKLEKYNSYFKEINNISNKMKINKLKDKSIKYSKEYDLFYCDKNNNINCSCCKDKICKLGNCLCIKCMNINKKYHELKSHYLINKCGRLAKVNKNLECFCLCYFIEDENPVICGSRNIVSKKIYICNSCRDLSKIILNYLNISQITQLIKKYPNENKN